MSAWLDYESFVELLHLQHRNGFSGLLTGVSGEKHSFHVGFSEGDIIYLSYRVVKGMAAIDKLLENDIFKAETFPMDAPKSNLELPPTAEILSLFSKRTKHPAATTQATPSNKAPSSAGASGPTPVVDSALTRAIKDAAVHFFGPIGAMVCDDHLQSIDLNASNVSDLLKLIIDDVGASSKEGQAFIDRVNQP